MWSLWAKLLMISAVPANNTYSNRLVVVVAAAAAAAATTTTSTTTTLRENVQVTQSLSNAYPLSSKCK